MDMLLISALATACILTAVEAFIRPLGKLRGLLGIVLNTAFCLILVVRLGHIGPYSLASTFLSLPLSLIVERIFVGVETKDLPNRIPPR